jgi:hypothetical protein
MKTNKNSPLNKGDWWYDKLTDLIEEEMVLSTGVKAKEHFSGDCRMNDIVELVRKIEKKAKPSFTNNEINYLISSVEAKKEIINFLVGFGEPTQEEKAKSAEYDRLIEKLKQLK